MTVFVKVFVVKSVYVISLCVYLVGILLHYTPALGQLETDPLKSGILVDPEVVAPPISLVPDQNNYGDDPIVFERSGALQSDVSILQLGNIGSGSLGIIDITSGGLSIDMWSGTSKTLVDRLFLKLPVKFDSVIQAELFRKLLLSVARPPKTASNRDVFVDITETVPSAVGLNMSPERNFEIKPDEPLDMVQEVSVLESRLTQLIRMGDWVSVASLINAVPQSLMTDNMRVMESDADLVEGRIGLACSRVNQNINLDISSYWQKLFAFCQLRLGNISGAFLTIDLLRETGLVDPAFFWVSELMAGNRPITPNGLRSLDPLELAMLRTTGRRFPDALVKGGQPTLLYVIANSIIEDPSAVGSKDNIDATSAELGVIDSPSETPGISAEKQEEIEKKKQLREVRLQAAEGSVSNGSLNPEFLRNLYRSEALILRAEEELEELSNFGEEVIEEAKLNLDSISAATPFQRAHLFMLAESQQIPTARAEVISRAIDFARTDRGKNGPGIGTVGLVFAPLIKDITPTGDLSWFAGNAARALIAAGSMEEGFAWLDLVKSYARTSIEAAEVSAAIWPIERHLRPDSVNKYTPLRFKRWEQSRPASRLSSDKVLVLTTLTALKESLNTEDWMDLLDQSLTSNISMPVSQAWHSLELASKGQRIGETVMLSLILLGDSGLSAVSPIVLAHVVSSLSNVGLEIEARRLAVEALLHRGL